MQMSFQAVLEAVDSSLPWTVVRIPFDPTEVWPARVKLRVKGTIRAANQKAEAFAFSTSLQSSHALGYFLLVTGKMKKAAHVQLGALAEIVLEPDLEGRAATPPPELTKLFRSDRSVKKWFETLNYSMRKYIADTIAEPKAADARVRRAEQWVETMMLTMEGEVEPPPILQIAFRRQPLARIGWDAMTSIQRRTQFMAIFQCRGPEARAKRTEWAIAEMIKAANRVGNRVASRKPGAKPDRDTEQ